MPVLDMPLGELINYQGRNPKPKDFDVFWDTGIAEAASLAWDAEFRPNTFSQPVATAYDLFFTGTGGSRVHAKVLVPKHLSGNAPAILHFHGYSGRSPDWSDLLNYAGAGFVVAAMDCRGQAGQSYDTVATHGPTLNGHIIRGLSDPDPTRMYYRNVFLDTYILAQIVMEMPEVDATKVAATGGSQGGGLACACAALVSNIRRLTAWYPFLSDYQRVWEMDLDQHAYAELRTYFRNFDPLHQREANIFEQLGYIDVHHLAARIQAETMMFVGLLDNVTPPSTVYAVFNHIASEKEMVVYPDFGHEGLPGASDLAFTFHCQP